MHRRVVICRCLENQAKRSVLLPGFILNWDESGPLPTCTPLTIRAKEPEPQEEAERQAKSSRKAKIRAICVLGGSNFGKKAHHVEGTFELSQELRKRKIHLVYGGGNHGLTGIIARAIHTLGGYVLGVIPRPLQPLAGNKIGEVKIVRTMHEKKAEMAHNADAFIALPGGFGTLDGLAEALSWAQLGIHQKPVGILNIEGYYDHLLSFLDQATEQGFIKPSHRNILMSAPNAGELLQKMEDYIPDRGPDMAKLKWETDEPEVSSARRVTTHLSLGPS